jgi:hypothetical protein
MAGSTGGQGRRLLVTVLAAVAVVLLDRVPLPGIDTSRLYATSPVDRPILGLFSLGLGPVISAFLVVEGVALLVPRWRRLRHGGYDERGRLWARTKVVAVVFSATQAFFVARWLEASQNYPTGPLLEILGDSPAGLLYAAFAIATGPFLLLWLVLLIERQGVGNGFSVVLAAAGVEPAARAVLSSVRRQMLDGERILMPVAIAAFVVAAVTISAGRLTAPDEERPIPVPASGLVPLAWTASLLALPAQLAVFGVGVSTLVAALAPGSAIETGARLLLITTLGALAAWLFQRRQPGLRRALPPTLGLLWAMLAAGWLADRAKLDFNLVNLAMVACVTADVASEHRFARDRGPLAAVRPLYRVYAVTPALAALAAAGIPAFPRGLRHRVLGHFFFPYVPVEILVSAEHRERAAALLEGIFGTRPPESVAAS